VPLLLRGAALGRLGFYEDSKASLQAAVELEGKVRHDTYAPPFALYELGAVCCAQTRTEEAKKVFERCAAVSYDFNFEVRGTRCGCVGCPFEHALPGEVQDAPGWGVGVVGANQVMVAGSLNNEQPVANLIR
jgi:hypothetical protein